ncbi:reverse transcriptase domain-containing protein [Rhizobium leguminosarum]|uniref:reverse transcriptase domain-containing protein n=1 Tax=Rhizobium leguminosarum TaxID=384 RepID=UPI00140FBB6E|nr:hypothetical protein HA463_38435 [Rhizobium leguminosarum bv. trifolii]
MRVGPSKPTVRGRFPDSYGYRPGKSALDAISVARQRCWRYNWVLDLDIKTFFDSIEPDLLMPAVRKHTDCPWVLLYIERWLKAPVQMPDGDLVARERGTPQGGVISPLLANLFLHYAFDMWMCRNFPDSPQRLLRKYLPPCRLLHPHPGARFAVKTSDRSRMR